MMKTKTINVYKFDELSNSAKEKARQWFRDCIANDDWYDCVYDDIKCIFDMLGVSSEKQVKLMNGSYRTDVAIWFSGFCSQGDGACFEGTYNYKKGAAKAIKAEYPTDERLQAIAQGLQDVQKKYMYGLHARVKHSGHYYHEMCTDIEVFNDNDNVPNDVQEEIKELLRDLMRWIYRALECEHDYLNSDKNIQESIEANEYEFDEYGDIA